MDCFEPKNLNPSADYSLLGKGSVSGGMDRIESESSESNIYNMSVSAELPSDSLDIVFVSVPSLENEFSCRPQKKMYVLNPLARSFHPPNFLNPFAECFKPIKLEIVEPPTSLEATINNFSELETLENTQ